VRRGAVVCYREKGCPTYNLVAPCGPSGASYCQSTLTGESTDESKLELTRSASALWLSALHCPMLHRSSLAVSASRSTTFPRQRLEEAMVVWDFGGTNCVDALGGDTKGEEI
jgi:hypothetical protein